MGVVAPVLCKREVGVDTERGLVADVGAAEELDFVGDTGFVNEGALGAKLLLEGGGGINDDPVDERFVALYEPLVTRSILGRPDLAAPLLTGTGIALVELRCKGFESCGRVCAATAVS